MPPLPAPTRPSRLRARAVRRPAVAAVMLVSLALAAGGCGGSDSSSPKSAPSGLPGTSTGHAPAGTVTLGHVAGNLHQPNRRIFAKHRKAVLTGVGASVDSWIEGGFVGVGYPRSSFPAAFAAFTKSAQHDARQQRALMTNWSLRKRIDAVTVKKQDVVVDVLAPNGRPAGATARVKLVFTTSGHSHKRVSITGRLFLVPDAKGSWRIFGFDVARGTK